MVSSVPSPLVSGKLRGAPAALAARWSALAPAQRRLLVLSLLALVALSSVSAWWSTRTDWRTLFGGLDGRDAAQVQQQLSAAGIAYQTTPDGTAVQVAAEQLDKARVAIAAKGMPQSGRLGFELFDKPNWIGSEFDERVNYQRALEGELEHTIESLDAVRSARVHIVLGKQGAFSSEDQPAKASVVLKLRRSGVPREQAESMRNLVACAVEGLQPAAVTLVDADGRADLSGLSTRASQHEEEAALEQKLVALLEPLAGAGNVHATVSLSYQQKAEEHTDEVYDPAGSVPVSTQRTEQTAQSTKASGVAGTASNTPAAAPAAAAVPNAAAPAANAATPAANANAPAVPAPLSAAIPASPGQTQLSREESSSFAVSRHVSHTEQAAGAVRRIAAAVVINDRAVMDGTGAHARTVWKPRSAEEMKRLEQIARTAVGFEEARGDDVAIQNVAFSSNVEELPLPAMQRVGNEAKDLLRSQPSLLRTLAIGGCLLLLGMLVVRPLGRQTVQLLQAGDASARIANAQLHLEGATESTHPGTNVAGIGTPATPRMHAPIAAPQAQTIFDQVTSRIKQEPQGSTRLIEAWLGSAVEEAE